MPHSPGSRSRPRARSGLRRAGRRDIERLVAIHTSAYPDARTYDARVRNFVRNPLGSLDDLWVLEDAGNVVAHAFLFPLEAWFGGQRVRLGGVATLGVAPEARGQGFGSRLLAHLHEKAHARGDALTALHPFRHAFYARRGYAGSSPYLRLRLHPGAIPWKPELRVRSASGRDWRALGSCWEAAGALGTGALVRSGRAWNGRLLDERRVWLVAEDQGALQGYVSWTIARQESSAFTTLVVHEMAARTHAAYRSLWGAVAAQRDGVSEVQAAVGYGDAFAWVLLDADRGQRGEAGSERLLGEVAAGPMLRVLDVARALRARGWPTAGSIVVEVEGERLAVVAEGGRAHVSKARAQPHVRLDRPALAAVAFGALRAIDAERLGWLTARDRRSLALADALFALPPYFSPDAF